jgi:hypothetical protein
MVKLSDLASILDEISNQGDDAAIVEYGFAAADNLE